MNSLYHIFTSFIDQLSPWEDLLMGPFPDIVATYLISIVYFSSSCTPLDSKSLSSSQGYIRPPNWSSSFASQQDRYGSLYLKFLSVCWFEAGPLLLESSSLINQSYTIPALSTGMVRDSNIRFLVSIPTPLATLQASYKLGSKTSAKYCIWLWHYHTSLLGTMFVSYLDLLHKTQHFHGI